MYAAKEWVDAVSEKLENAGPEGAQAIEYIHKRKIKIGFKKQSASTAAMWDIDGNIYLNPKYYNEKDTSDPYMLSLIAHEAWHLRQGPVVALSVYGELEAWQLGFRIYQQLTNRMLHPAILQLMDLKLCYERPILKRAAELMQEYSGKGYRIDLLPLYPLHKEIVWFFTRKTPA